MKELIKLLKIIHKIAEADSYIIVTSVDEITSVEYEGNKTWLSKLWNHVDTMYNKALWIND